MSGFRNYSLAGAGSITTYKYFNLLEQHSDIDEIMTLQVT